MWHLNGIAYRLVVIYVEYFFEKDISVLFCNYDLKMWLLFLAHSTEKEAALSMSWLSRNSSLEDHTKFENAPKKSGSGPPSVINQNSNLELQDGSESRGSASPRSYDSRYTTN